MGKIRFSIAAVTFLLFLTVFIPTVQANDGDTYDVSTDVLHVRSAPSQSADVVGYLGSDDQVVVFQEKYGWAQTYYNGQAAWVASQYLLPAEDDTVSGAADSSESERAVDAHTANNPSSALSGYNIVLDPGHGGKDPGAMGIDGVLEKDLTMTTAESVVKKLRDAGANVILTRSDDSYVSLENRVSISHSHNTDAFISLHYNAYPLEEVNGFNTYYDSNGDEKEMAEEIQSALEENLELNSRGFMQNGYHVLNENSDLSVLVELGFMTNPYDLSIIQTDDHKANVADGIVEGVTEYFNH